VPTREDSNSDPKKDAPPSIPVPPPVVPQDSKDAVPPPIEVRNPGLKTDKEGNVTIVPPVAPPLEKDSPKPKTETPTFPPPKVNDVKAPEPPPVTPTAPEPPTMPTGPVMPPPLPPTPPEKDAPKPNPETRTLPPLNPVKPAVDDAKPLPTQEPLVPPLKDKEPTKPIPGVKPPVPAQDWKPSVDVPKVASPMQPIVDEVAKLKNCPWSLQIEVIDGQTIVTATVNKKHEFKIVCQSLDLQTGKGTLKASGKVQITGDMMSASCDSLAIPLMEDRLLLEGAAQVSIQKNSTVSTERPARFELKGDRFDLRVSDLNPDRAVQASPIVLPPPNTIQLVSNPAIKFSDASRTQTPYGTLRRFEAKVYPGNEPAMWKLEDRDGNVIARVLARQGGSLRSFEGQRVSLIGVTERIDGETYLRATHVALP
jgi:hypothetical protein